MYIRYRGVFAQGACNRMVERRGREGTGDDGRGGRGGKGRGGEEREEYGGEG